MDWMKLWPEVVVILGALSDAFHGQISGFITAHPTIAMVLGTLLMIIGKFQQSPMPPKA